MQYKIDATREELLNSPDVLSETHWAIRKLKTAADLLNSYRPECEDFEEVKNIMMGASHIIRDAAEEIDYLIDVSNEEWRRDRDKWKNP